MSPKVRDVVLVGDIYALNDPLRSVDIKGRKDIVQQNDLTIGVDCSSKCNPSLLAPAQRQALLIMLSVNSLRD